MRKAILALAALLLASAGSAQPLKVEFVTLGTGGGPQIRVKRAEPAWTMRPASQDMPKASAQPLVTPTRIELVLQP